MDTASLIASVLALLPPELRARVRKPYNPSLNFLNVTAAGTAGATAKLQLKADAAFYFLGLLANITIRNPAANSVLLADHPMTISVTDASQRGLQQEGEPNDVRNVFGKGELPGFFLVLIDPGQQWNFTLVNLGNLAVDARLVFVGYNIPK